MYSVHLHNFLVFTLLSAGPLKPRGLGHSLVGLCHNPALPRGVRGEASEARPLIRCGMTVCAAGPMRINEQTNRWRCESSLSFDVWIGITITMLVEYPLNYADSTK